MVQIEKNKISKISKDNANCHKACYIHEKRIPPFTYGRL